MHTRRKENESKEIKKGHVLYGIAYNQLQLYFLQNQKALGTYLGTCT